MPQWVLAIVSLIKRMIIWFGGYLPQPSVRETKEPVAMQQKQHVVQGWKRGKKQRNRERREQAEARLVQSQSKIKELEQQLAEMKLKQQEELVPQQETKSRPCEESMEKKLRSELDEKSKEIGRLQETVADLNDQIAHQSKFYEEKIAKIYKEQIAHPLKVEQDWRPFSEQLQPAGEDDQIGVPVIHVATDGEQPRLQSGTLDMENEFPSSASEATTSKMLVAARTKPKNSEDENKSVEDGLNKPYQPFSRKSSFSSEASVLPAIGTAVPSEGELAVRQIGSDYKIPLSDIEKGITPELRNRFGDELLKCISGKDNYFSTLVRIVMCLKLEKPQLSDLANREWLRKHHFPKFENGCSLQQFFKEILRSDKEADKWLEILEKAATEGKGELGRQSFRFLKKIAEANHKVHPKVDLEEVIRHGCKLDGEYFLELFEYFKGKRN